MKFVQSFPLSTFFFTGFGCSGANGYLYSSRPFPRRSCKPGIRLCDCFDGENLASSTRNDRYRQCKYNVDQDFRDLQNELGEIKADDEDGKFNWVKMGSTQDPFEKFDEDASKKWIEKAFDLASELNKDFAATPKEKERNDEVIQESRDWFARLYKDQEEFEATNEGGDSFMNQADSLTSPGKKPEDPDTVTKWPTPSHKTKQDEILSEIPESENRSSKEMFQVAVDLPGVKRADVDVTLDGDFLVIIAMRNTGSVGQTLRKYEKKITFRQNEVDMDKMEASLNHGELLISVPINKPAEEKRKIPVT